MGGKAINPTTGRNIRIRDDRWERFGELAPKKPGRSELINDFIAWYVREPGAKLPKRPDATPGEPG
jgi:hypothetical protein